MINARVYTSEQVGIATALISVAGLISGLSYLFIHMGLMGIGISWIIGQGVTAMIYLVIIKKLF
ncbi:hypothetical protein KJ980_01710 [Patescibacteria group bacterium]|nr:hypothetical protein [Patescibacteria group bacterium]MBU4098344.1 hypothetical protein [Patescibacteria group bacterium]